MKRTDKSEKDGLESSGIEAELGRLMSGAQGGDAESYRQLLTKVKILLVKYVANSFARLGLKATGGQEDVVQEILLAIHLKKSTFDSNQFFIPWMYAIARYKVIDYLRKNKVLFRSSIPISDELENLEQMMVLEVAGVEHDLEKLCDCLPEKQRDVLLLVKREGLSIEEAAQKTGFSSSDIKVTVHRAIKTLQKRIKESEHENG